MITFVVLIFAIRVFHSLIWYISNSSTRPPLPPGPPGDPLIGHLRIIPRTGIDIFFYNLGKLYGDVIHFNVLGRPVIVLNSVRAAVELLDKRGANYSDRPYLPIYEIAGFGDSLVFLQYGKSLQQHRRMYQQYLSKSESTAYYHVQAQEACVLVQNIMEKPNLFEEHLVRYSTAVITHIAYGHRITSDSDPYLSLAKDIYNAFANAGPIGATMVDLLPLFRYLPSWFPGTYYVNYARAQRALVANAHEYPYRDFKRQMASGTAKPSFLASQLQGIKDDDENADAIRRIQAAATTLHLGGIDTTSAYMSYFFLAMVLHPECQAKAQEEISKVVGSSRLPEFGDRPLLPYVECVLQETLRWNQVGPLGVPHQSSADDVYKGMFIPKGSTVIANIRAMTLDTDVYTDPFRFNPARYLPKPEGLGEPYPIGPFGFGRRICLGRHLASNGLWIAMTTILATISILEAIDKDGNEITPELAFANDGPINRPRPFPCRLQPRSDAAQSLIAHANLSYS